MRVQWNPNLSGASRARIIDCTAADSPGFAFVGLIEKFEATDMHAFRFPLAGRGHELNGRVETVQAGRCSLHRPRGRLRKAGVGAERGATAHRTQSVALNPTPTTPPH